MWQKGCDHLTNEQLVLRIKAGEDTAANMLKLWEQNKGMIYKIALKFKGQEEIEDLVQQGYLGLYDAVENYNPDFNVKFMTYAGYWIHQNLKRYIENCGSCIRIPVYKQDLIKSYHHAVNRFEIRWGRKPIIDEIAILMDLSIEKVKNIEKSINTGQISSLDSDTEYGETWINNIQGSGSVEERVIEKINERELANILWGMVDELEDDSARVIYLRYRYGKKRDEISKTLEMSTCEVRKAEEKALKKLSMPSRRMILRRYTDGLIRDMALKENSLQTFKNTWTSSTERTALNLTMKEKRFKFRRR